MTRSTLAGLMVAFVLMAGTARAASTGSTKQLLLRPSVLHPGDLVYLSGRNFQPHHRLVVQIACRASSPRSPHVAVMLPGPRTNARGTFAGFAAHTPMAVSHHCVVYAGEATSGFSARAIYRAVPQAEGLPPCSMHMCMHVKALLVRLRNQTQGTVVVSGWPGATARIAVTGPTIHPKYRRVRLNWRGVASVRMRIALGLVKSTASRVSVRARLGHTHGVATARFAVIPGGR